MNLGAFALIITIAAPLLLMLWNRQRVKGKILCVIVRKDKSTIMKLCELWNDFVIFEDRAYDVYPDYVRLTRFPMGWPAMFQELVPSALYNEEDAIPLDWIDLDERKESSMNLKSALEENWVRKLVHEAATEGAGFKLNWRKILPIALIVLGAIGLVIMFVIR
jgi:hypothetical protein